MHNRAYIYMCVYNTCMTCTFTIYYIYYNYIIYIFFNTNGSVGRNLDLRPSPSLGGPRLWPCELLRGFWPRRQFGLWAGGTPQGPGKKHTEHTLTF